ncbi:MAG: outer membrane lipoprotein chaperone LolA [Gammaproteobacteria bacterium]
MFKQTKWLLVPLLAAITLTAMGEEDPAVASLREFLSGTTTLEADFSQALASDGIQDAQISSGRFYLQRPGRFRWDYREPSEQLVISDGEQIWMYDSDLEQVTVRAVDESLRGTPAMLLSGDAELDESFAVGEIVRVGELDFVTLLPLQPSPEFESLKVGLREGQIVSMELLDGIGQRSLIEFSDLRRDQTLDPALFHFTPPPGVDVIGAGD